ncbi:hypothetical protein LZG00_18355 [Rhodobacteraceae bacterium LMO-12]|nr:hypothetical protein [Rhodobacteraceae bacterium LMO-JJ12]
MNFYAVGFVGVLGLVGVGVDYQQQSAKSGLSLGQMSVQQYVDTYEARFLGAKAAKRAEEREQQRQSDWRSGGIAFLPEAPEGWTRRKYSEDINTAIMPDSVTYYEEMAKNGTAVSVAESIKSEKAHRKALAQDAVSWVYERGDEAVLVSLRTKEAIKENSISGMIGMAMGAMSSVSHHSVRGYQVVGGVGFVELPQQTSGPMAVLQDNDGNSKLGGFDRAHFRRLVGTVGFNQEVIVAVHANAPLESTLEILNAVDWDGINSMLKTPMAMVGNDVILPETTDHQQIAVQMMRQRNLFNELRERAADFKVASSNAAMLLFNQYADGNYDISSGTIPDLGQLIDMGFRKEIRDLIAGKPSEGEYQRIKAMMVERPEAERVTPKGEMNDGLREELMGGIAPAQRRGEVESPDDAETDFAMTDGEVDYSSSKAFTTVKMPNELSTEQVVYFKHTQKVARQKGDGPAQQAARLMELDRGLPPGACLVRHDNGKVACNKNADAVRKERQRLLADAAEVDSDQTVKVTRMSTGKTRNKSSGCGAGKFCKADQ